MDDRNNMWPNREGFNPNEGKLRSRSLWQRYRWQLIASSSLILMLIFAFTTVQLLLNRPANQSTTAPASTQQPHTQAATTPILASTETPTPVSTPTRQAQALPCTVNLNTWTDGSADWKVLNGLLLNDGTKNWDSGSGPTIVAPCDIGLTTNYAVETKIQVTSSQNYACFGITVRGTPNSNGWQGYKAGVGNCYNNLNRARVSGPNYNNDSQIKDASFDPSTSPHSYRIEVKDNTIKFFIDGGLILSMIDNRYLSGAEVGLWSQNTQLTVLSFKATAL